MSKTVDERVVSMQFDNKQFEANVQTSMSTLDKLKQKLDFKPDILTFFTAAFTFSKPFEAPLKSNFCLSLSSVDILV